MAAMTTVPTPATDKQVSFLTKLSVERGVATAEDIATLAAKGLDKRTASNMIDALMKSRPVPAAPVTPDVPAGRYALRNANDGNVYFFQVDRPTEGRWAGWTFIKRISGDNLLKIEKSEQKQILAAIEADPIAAIALYGSEREVCGLCGRGLTDETSRTLGIGPVCIKKFGDGAEDHAWKLAVARREAEQERAAHEADLYDHQF